MRVILGKSLGHQQLFTYLYAENQKIDSMNEFKIRSYGRTELAQLYNPELTAYSAYRKLMQWITHSQRLTDQLRELGYDPRRRTFTPLEVKAIVEALGEP